MALCERPAEMDENSEAAINADSISDIAPSSNDRLPFNADDPLSELTSADAFNNFIAEFRTYAPVPLILAMQTLSDWRDAHGEEENESLQDQYDGEIAGQIATSPEAPEDEEDTPAAFDAFFYQQLNITIGTYISILVNPEINESREKFIAVSPEQSELLERLYDVQMHEAGDRHKCLAEVRITDREGAVVAEHDIPIFIDREMETIDWGNVVVSRPIARMLKIPRHEPHFFLEIANVRTDTAKTEFQTSAKKKSRRRKTK